MGDVGCFGNDTIHTPNIDSIARQGVKFSHHVIPAPLCSPSRAAFITGRHPVRSGMLGYGRLRMVPFLAATAGLPPNETTFAEVLKDVGYKTGLVGKWHMGLHCENRQDFCHHPLKQGFDFYYGLPLTNLRDCGEDATRSVITARIPQMTEILALSMVIVVVTLVAFTKIGLIQRRGFIFLLAVSFIIFATPVVLQKGLRRINCILMKNYDVVEQPVILENMTLRITQQSMQFLKSSQNEAFLLYVSFLKVHTALFSSSKFKGISKHGNYGDNVEEMDWSVGKILSTLEELGLKENTFVYLTSDNGGHLEEIASDGQREGGHNGIYRGGKAQVWEGGLRVPTVAMYPGVIPPSTEVMQPTSNMDIFPTIIKLANASLPSDRVIDGRDLMPLISKKINISQHEFMFHYCGAYLQALRYQPRDAQNTYKIYFATPNWTPGTEACFEEFVCHCFGNHVTHHDPPIIYDLTSDPAERHPINVDDSRHSLIVKKAKMAVKKHEESLETVPAQYSAGKLMWLPWLQPCCNFPICYCREDEDHESYL